jgi:hypothetical protein
VGQEDGHRVVVGLGEAPPGGEAMTSVRTPPQLSLRPARSTLTFKPSPRTPRKDLCSFAIDGSPLLLTLPLMGVDPRGFVGT